MIRAGRNRARTLQASELQRLFRLSYGALLVQHGDSRARERHQLVGYQVDEHVRHRAVERLESEPSQVARTDTTWYQNHPRLKHNRQWRWHTPKGQ